MYSRSEVVTTTTASRMKLIDSSAGEALSFGERFMSRDKDETSVAPMPAMGDETAPTAVNGPPCPWSLHGSLDVAERPG